MSRLSRQKIIGLPKVISRVAARYPGNLWKAFGRSPEGHQKAFERAIRKPFQGLRKAIWKVFGRLSEGCRKSIWRAFGRSSRRASIKPLETLQEGLWKTFRRIFGSILKAFGRHLKAFKKAFIDHVDDSRATLGGRPFFVALTSPVDVSNVVVTSSLCLVQQAVVARKLPRPVQIRHMLPLWLR